MSCWHWRWLLDWQKTQATVRVCKFIPDVNIPIGSHFTQVSCLFAQIAPTAADIAVHTLMYVRLAVPALPVSLCVCLRVCVCVCVCVEFAIFALYCCQSTRRRWQQQELWGEQLLTLPLERRNMRNHLSRNYLNNGNIAHCIPSWYGESFSTSSFNYNGRLRIDYAAQTA